MSKVLMESLKMDLPALAELIRSKGRGKDSVLAHITPKEAALLKRRGGKGSTNPDTGLLEFDDGDFAAAPEPAPAPAPVQDYSQPAPPADVSAQPATPTDTSGGYGISYGAPQTPLFTGAPEAGTLVSQPYNPDLSATSQYGIQAAPPSITPSGLAQTQPFGTIAGTPTTPTVDTGTTKQPPSFTDKLTASLTDPTNLARLGLTAGLGLFGAGQARKAAQQGQAVTGQEQAIATPYQQQGQQLITQAQTGTLSPASQQAYNAAKAQLAQAQATRGGVGAQQAANQLSDIYQRLLNNQYTYGLQVMQIGDNISLGAIRTGLQLDQTLNQTTQNFYSQLAAIAAGGGGGGVPQTVRVVA
jgi:hypothetical protein